ncbi:hypothetical protein Tco_1281818 [Tanacetum coccineum]
MDQQNQAYWFRSDPQLSGQEHKAKDGGSYDNGASMPDNFDELLQSITYIAEDQAPKKLEVAQEQEIYETEIEAIHKKLMACKTSLLKMLYFLMLLEGYQSELSLMFGTIALQKGLLLEFKKDAERILLAVAQKPDGRRNWIVSDQDPSLLEFAWLALLEGNNYCVHLLLSRDEVYVIVLDSKGSSSIYGPRLTAQPKLLDEKQQTAIFKGAVDAKYHLKMKASRFIFCEIYPVLEKPGKSFSQCLLTSSNIYMNVVNGHLLKTRRENKLLLKSNCRVHTASSERASSNIVESKSTVLDSGSLYGKIGTSLTLQTRKCGVSKTGFYMLFE